MALQAGGVPDVRGLRRAGPARGLDPGPGNQFYEAEGKKRFQRTLELPATRGKILDRNGLVLATSLPVKAIWAVPEDVPNQVEAAKIRQLAKLLGMSEKDLGKKLSEDKGFVYLKRQVLPDVADKIAALKIEGVHQTREYKRFYPEGEAMAHIVGFTNVEDRGQEGVELAREPGLAGRAGARQVIKDRLGRVVEDVGVLKTPRDGEDIQLSIDAKIQYLAYNELKAVVERHKAKAASAVVLDAQTGEVLALANWPTYNPNDRSRLSGEQLRNRVLTDTFEPGSMMKPITVGLALQLKRVTPSTVITTTGKYNFEGATISDTHNYGALTVSGVIQKSSNIGTTKIAMLMKPQEMWDMFTSVGLGQAPKIGFPGAVAGRVRPFKSWRPIEQATMSYGYGLSVSLFQMAHAYTIFAHDGELIPVSMFRTSGPVTGERVLSPQVARDVRAMLETVTAPGGTAPEAQVMGWPVPPAGASAWTRRGRAGSCLVSVSDQRLVDGRWHLAGRALRRLARGVVDDELDDDGRREREPHRLPVAQGIPGRPVAQCGPVARHRVLGFAFAAQGIGRLLGKRVQFGRAKRRR